MNKRTSHAAFGYGPRCLFKPRVFSRHRVRTEVPCLALRGVKHRPAVVARTRRFGQPASLPAVESRLNADVTEQLLRDAADPKTCREFIIYKNPTWKCSKNGAIQRKAWVVDGPMTRCWTPARKSILSVLSSQADQFGGNFMQRLRSCGHSGCP